MLFWQFSNIIIYVKIVLKNTRSKFECMVIFQSRGQVQILVRSTGQICPIILYLFWTLSPGFENNHTFKCWSGIFPTILTYMIVLENCQNNISVYGWSAIQGTQFYSCWKGNRVLLSLGQRQFWNKQINYVFKTGATFPYCNWSIKMATIIGFGSTSVLNSWHRLGRLPFWVYVKEGYYFKQKHIL